LLDFAQNRSLTQYRFYLDGFSDWDNREDYISTNTSSSTYWDYSPKIIYTLSDGVSNIDPTITQPQISISSYPNPFSDISSITVKASDPGLNTLNIYNIKGQLIRSYRNSSQSSIDRTFQWDGRDDTGRQVSGGIYIAVVESGRNRVSSKILYIK